LYLSAVIEENWVCRGLFRVATTRNVGQDLATFGDVADMSPTCGAKDINRASNMRETVNFSKN